MTQVWATAKPEWLIWLATRKGVLTDRELHEFWLWCALQVEHLMTDERSRNALRVKRLWLDGKANDEELSAARSAAFSAASSADHAAYEHARAAFSASCAVARVAASYADGDAQSEWLRENTNPKFDL